MLFLGHSLIIIKWTWGVFFQNLQFELSICICNLIFSVPNEIPAAFYNSWNYNYHFIVKELANEFEGQFQCLRVNTERHKTYSIPIGKVDKEVNNERNENIISIS